MTLPRRETRGSFAAEVFRYALPVVRPLPLRTASVASERIGWIVRLTRTDATRSDGEPVTAYGDVAPLNLAPANLKRIESGLLEAVEAFVASGDSSITAMAPCIRFGIHAALDGIAAQIEGVPLHEWYAGDAPQETVTVNALLSTDASDATCRRLLDEGYRCFKVKVGRGDPATESDDICRIAETLDRPSTGARIRLDANRAWTMAEACHFAKRIADLDIDFIEEPLDESDRLEELYYRTGWPIALDETISELSWEASEYDGDSVASMLRTAAGYAEAVVLKPSTMGPPRRALAVAAAARAAGLRVVVGSSLESGIGLRTLVALAAHPGLHTEASGLSTHDLFAFDVCEPPIRFGATVDVGRLVATPFQLTDRVERVAVFP